jgi:signal peptidase II
MIPSLRRRLPYGLLIVALVGLDQATKLLVDRLMSVHESRSIIDGFLQLTYVQNHGGAFGFLSDANLPYQSVGFAVVSLLALGAIAYYSLRLPPENRLPQVALALVMSGAVGNLIDRAVRGYVVDFVDVYWGRYHWPAFNVADSSISVGVSLLVLDMLRAPRREAPPKGEVAAAPVVRTD